MISDHLNTYLNAQSSITSIVSTRIYPVILPQKPTYPAITYRDDDHDVDETFAGQSGPTDSIYSIDAWATTYAGTTTLGNAIRTALVNTAEAFGGINIHKCILITGPATFYEDAVEAYRQTQTFIISHNEV